jgi:hypothetical protein
MKSLVLFISLLLGMASCSKKTYNFTLNDYRTVEGIKIGMPIQKAINVLDKKKFVVEKKKIIVLDDEPEAIEYLVTSNKKVPLFTFNGGHNNNKNNVFRIVIKSPNYITPEGISVGMTVKELKTKTTIKSADFNFQDGLFLLSAKFDGGFWIHHDNKKDYKFTYDKPAIKDIPAELTIKGIVIF